MNIKKVICIVSIFLLSLGSIEPIKAKTAEHVLLLSEDLPYIIYIDINAKSSITLNFIPVDIMIPLSCANKIAAPLSSLNIKESKNCVKTSIEHFFNVKIDHMVYLHLDKISRDTHISKNLYNFNKITDFTSYFGKVVSKINAPMILNYQKYITSDLSLFNYYNYYNLTKHKIKVKYGYMKYIISDTLRIPMDNEFHLKT